MARAFEEFARGWMARLSGDAREERDRVRSQARQPGAPAKSYTYRVYLDEFHTRLERTGKAAAPYVGILVYTEELWRCVERSPESCMLVESSPISEFFAWSNGRWRY